MKKYLTGMVLLGLLEIGLALFLTFWRKDFWSAVELRQATNFLYQLGIFTGVALLLCFVASFATYLGTLAAIKWRQILNLKASAYVLNSRIENVNQRIQEDCREYPNLVVIIGYGAVKSIVYCVVFAIALCLQFSYTYLLIILGYGIISTFIAKRIANPLIALQYKSQQVEASYRNDLSINNFSDCISIMLGVAKRTKRLNYFQQFYGQLGVILPICIIAPSYFNAAITFGQLMQAQSTMGTILDNTSYGINTFDSINRLLSCRRRLKELGVI